MVVSELVSIIDGRSVMPTSTMLKEIGRHDLDHQISKRGGYAFWAKRVGVERKHSDSDTGWDGEIKLAEILTVKGFSVERSTAVKWPYDLCVDGVRIDVKTAKYAEYGACRGWFYRVGKYSQSDVLAFFQMDTTDCYFLPWQICPTSNVTISRDGGKYAQFKNRFDILKTIIEHRKQETAFWK